jgi:hypothetical protein
MELGTGGLMTRARHLIICALLFGLVTSPASAERLKINFVLPPEQPIVAAKMHPSAKGALIGGAVGAGLWGGVGVWYCTVGPNEAGECSNTGQWARGMLLWGAVGAGVGALIGALR